MPRRTTRRHPFPAGTRSRSRTARSSPQTPNYRGTLGTARYRAADYSGAIAELEKALSLGKPADSDKAAAGFFLAMAHWRQQDRDKAHLWFDKAGQWMEKGHKDDAELKRFRAEAARLLERPQSLKGGEAPNEQPKKSPSPK